ncbi:MAG: hypothetical protein A2381_04065 [Bdellovibrionales bacterium RIFOXYB1_FULL_37_110]|nr:MAG: hypothetical protein A2417_10175 [Bdellovibrionales bacterium RIFOXYC1_FULL_37_79]OFZ59098.1 MAG: hypothetical protein A2381_04065 [Bdellovibrionales bacterium RIFOXYB1_FULL_37_110]OFZ64105.1 MAG: hypothetical protein A2577_15185 [Bdellovibrionales bacterium RIFOXYD1_FULL_36_51]
MLLNLETPQLLLRPFTLNDTSIIFSLSQETGMKQWIPDQVYQDLQQTTDILKYLISQYHKRPNPAVAPIVFAIVLKKSNLVIGHVGLSPYKDSIEIGYAIGEKHCGKGYASQAVLAYSNWALDELEISKIWGIVVSQNQASRRVLEKVGFIFLNEKKQMYHGKFQPCCTYYLTNSLAS